MKFIPLLGSFTICAIKSHAQDIDLAGVIAAPAPVIVTPSYAVASQTASVAPVSAQASAAAATVSAVLATSDGTLTSRDIPLDHNVRDTGIKRSIEKRGGNCAPQPSGFGPVASPDTPAAFANNTALQTLAINAETPYGYSQVFSNVHASISASVYMGLHTLTSYDVAGCQSRCDQATGCLAFNIYAERDPSVNPDASSCSNPSSTTNFVCTLWGVPVSASQATNSGQWRGTFQILIAASNAYNKNANPPAVNGYSGPTELGGAINAPLDAGGHNTYMGYGFFAFSQTQGFNPSTCAAACDAQTQYDATHPASDGSYMACNFFNMYVLSKNGSPIGLYCSNYNETWGPSYATNYGQYWGTDHYTVSDSYSYSRYTDSDYVAQAKAVIASSSLQPYCSTLLEYNVASIQSTATTTTTTTTIDIEATISTGVTTVLTTDVGSTTTTTLSHSQANKRDIGTLATPAALSGFAGSIITSACNAEATPTTTYATGFITVVATTNLTTGTTDVPTSTVTDEMAAATVGIEEIIYAATSTVLTYNPNAPEPSNDCTSQGQSCGNGCTCYTEQSGSFFCGSINLAQAMTETSLPLCGSGYAACATGSTCLVFENTAQCVPTTSCPGTSGQIISGSCSAAGASCLPGCSCYDSVDSGLFCGTLGSQTIAGTCSSNSGCPSGSECISNPYGNTIFGNIASCFAISYCVEEVIPATTSTLTTTFNAAAPTSG